MREGVPHRGHLFTVEERLPSRELLAAIEECRAVLALEFPPVRKEKQKPRGGHMWVVQMRPSERVLDVPVRQVWQEIVGVARLAPQERARVAEHTVAVPERLILGGSEIDGACANL